MFFKKKSKKEEAHCQSCRSEVNEKYSFCPYCGEDLIDYEQEKKDFGMLGKDDMSDDLIQQAFGTNTGITDKLIGSLMNSIIKSLDVQLRDADRTEVKSFPNGIKIKLGVPHQKKQDIKITNKQLTDAQLERISKLPRTEAKASVRRLSDKVIYELSTAGVASVEDVIISRLESGYEVKAIGKNKVYVNSFPITLPLKNFTVRENGVVLEFSTQ